MPIGEACIHEGPNEMQMPQTFGCYAYAVVFKLNANIMFLEVRNFLSHGLQQISSLHKEIMPMLACAR